MAKCRTTTLPVLSLDLGPIVRNQDKGIMYILAWCRNLNLCICGIAPSSDAEQTGSEGLWCINISRSSLRKQEWKFLDVLILLSNNRPWSGPTPWCRVDTSFVALNATCFHYFMSHSELVRGLHPHRLALCHLQLTPLKPVRVHSKNIQMF